MRTFKPKHLSIWHEYNLDNIRERENRQNLQSISDDECNDKNTLPMVASSCVIR